GIALLLAAAQRGIRFIDHDDDRAHRTQHGEHALEIAFRLADVLRSEILEDDARHADLAADALRKERLAGSDRSAKQISHRQAVERAALQQGRIFTQPRLGRLVTDDRVEGPLRLDELEQAVTLTLQQPFLQRSKNRGVEAVATLARRLNEDVEVCERNP